MVNKTQFQLDLETVIKKLSDILVDKNNKYGDSALNPINCFSKLSAKEAILIRCDDKLSRLRNNQDGDTEDPMLDLWGYLTLYQIAEYREKAPGYKIDHNDLGGEGAVDNNHYKNTSAYEPAQFIHVPGGFKLKGNYTGDVEPAIKDNTLGHIQDGGEQTSVKTQKIGFLDEVTPKRRIDIENEKKQTHYDRSRGIVPE